MNRALAWLGVTVALSAPWQAFAAHANPVRPSQPEGAQAAGPLRPLDPPVAFEANRGQSDARVRYTARLRDMDVYLAPGGAVLSMFARDRDARANEPDAVALRLQFVGANPDPRIDGVDALPGRVNYIRGGDDSHVDIPVFRRVRYRDVYPGVDVVYYGRDGKLEFDVEVAPGADPGVVRLRFEGASELALDHDGDLRVRTPLGDVVQRRPVVYQTISGRRHEVAGRYVLDEVAAAPGTRELAFVVGGYDPRHALVLDPTLVAVSMVGGSGTETSAAVAADAGGNWYFAGHTASSGTGFPTTVGAYQAANAGSTDVFVRKVGNDGSTLVYSTLIGGGALDTARGLAVGPTGIAYVVGQTTSTNFPTQNALQPTKPSAGADPTGFVTALNASGSGLVYSTYLGGATALGPASTDVRDVAVDPDGNAYVTGETNTTDLPTSATAFQATSMGQFSAFVFKLDAAGARRFGTYLVDDDNGFGTDRGAKIALDAARNVYVAGQANAAFANDYNGLAPAKIGPGGGSFDVLVARLNHTGEWLDWIALAGGTSIDTGAALDVDPAGRLMLGARSLSTDLVPDTAHDANWVWLAELDGSTGTLRDSRWLGGAGSSSNIFVRDLVWDGTRVVAVGDVQNPSTLTAIDPVAGLDCGASCGTSATTGAFVCSYTSHPIAEESCTRVVTTGGSGAGGARHAGVAQASPIPSRPDDTLLPKQASADRKAIAAHGDGTYAGATNTSGTTQQQVQAFLDFLFGPRPTLPPVVQKTFGKRIVRPGEIVRVVILVGNPRANSASIVDFTMEDNLPPCLSYVADNIGGIRTVRDASGRVVIGLTAAGNIPPGGYLFADFYVKAGSATGPCTNTTSAGVANTGTAPPASATLTIEEDPCQASTSGACTVSSMTDAACWVGGVLPKNGCDAEIVPCTAPGACTITNDQPLGEKIGAISFADEAFSFVGNTAFFAEGIQVPAGGNATVATRVETIDDELGLAVAGVLDIEGVVALKNAELQAYETGTLLLEGGIEGVGEVDVFEGTTRIETIAPTFAGDIVVYGGRLATAVPIVQPIALMDTGLLEGEGPYGRIDISGDATWSTSNDQVSTVSNSALTVSGAGRVIVDAGAQATVHDTIAVAGPVVLGGGTLELRALSTFDDGTSYDIITSASGITGCFDDAVTDVPGVAASVTCTANTVTATVDVQVDVILVDGFENP